MNERHQGIAAPDVNALLDQIQKLPSMPTLVLEILESINDENINTATLTKKISHDQAIVARILRVANSPFFGLSGKISSISTAITMLGLNNLRGLVMAAGIIGAFKGIEKKFDWRAFWQHNIATAVCAKVLARQVGLNPETAFTAGLLHDIGKLVIGFYYPQVFSQLPSIDSASSQESLQIEQNGLGLDHAALGAEIAMRWYFPLEIQQAIARHHQDSLSDHQNSISGLIFIANFFAHALDHGRIHEDKEKHLVKMAWSYFRLDASRVEALAAEAQQLYDGTIFLMD